MPKDETLFETAKGSIVDGFFLMLSGSANVPPMWIERYRGSRKKLHKEIAQIFHKGDFKGIAKLREWEEKFKKECFFYGIKALLDLKRKGKTKY